ncbi:recombinase family protein [Wolbachia endosymbiont (group A) of Oxytorus armatus]|uniref:recombinase family protein n=1 Tax=Wolbachia endosymbiont (group A) of Oxytorus armatus TaxID=3066211 RepID=UPI0031331619
MVTVSLYARVSSGKQAQEDTIASQIATIENQISMDGHKLLNEYKFIDNGYSGSNIIRPGLEKLRDKIAEGNIDKVYIHSPDRLSRKYAYQMILLEEFKKLGVEVIFLNHQISDNPESQLLLQMQGMIAEYERAKIMERSRRGKIYAANKGCISVMSAAPYGYRYINKNTETGQALFEIYEEEAEVVRKVFSWVGRERASIGEVCRRLSAMSIMTRTGKEYWDRAVVLSMLKNSAYKGQAAFGKTRFGVKLKHIRPKKNSCEHPKDNYSTYPVPKEDWIYIKVPSIVSEDLFEIVQEQLAENRKIARTRQRGARHLLQGLVVCKLCNYAYYGTSTARNKEGEKTNNQVYYRCVGTDSYRFGGNKMCNNKLIRTDTLDMAVWEEVKHLLKNPNRILEEYKRRLSELKKSPLDQKSALLEIQEDKLKRGIARLIDSYAQEYIDQEEFEPRIKAMKQNLKMVEEQKKKIFDQKKLTQELTLVVTNLEGFSSSINSSLNNADWLTKRDIIRTLVKRIEINFEDVNIVFRVKELPDSFHMEKNQCLQCCCRGRYDGSWRHDVEFYTHQLSIPTWIVSYR